MIKESFNPLFSSLTDVFSMCYQTKASDSYKILIRKSTMWGDATCLKMAMAADARIFFSNDGVQVLQYMQTVFFTIILFIFLFFKTRIFLLFFLVAAVSDLVG